MDTRNWRVWGVECWIVWIFIDPLVGNRWDVGYVCRATLRFHDTFPSHLSTECHAVYHYNAASSS